MKKLTILVLLCACIACEGPQNLEPTISVNEALEFLRVHPMTKVIQEERAAIRAAMKEYFAGLSESDRTELVALLNAYEIVPESERDAVAKSVWNFVFGSRPSLRAQVTLTPDQLARLRNATLTRNADLQKAGATLPTIEKVLFTEIVKPSQSEYEYCIDNAYYQYSLGLYKCLENPWAPEDEPFVNLCIAIEERGFIVNKFRCLNECSKTQEQCI